MISKPAKLKISTWHNKHIRHILIASITGHIEDASVAPLCEQKIPDGAIGLWLYGAISLVGLLPHYIGLLPHIFIRINMPTNNVMICYST